MAVEPDRLRPEVCGICGNPAGEVAYRCARHQHISSMLGIADAIRNFRANKDKEEEDGGNNSSSKDPQVEPG